MGKAPRVEGHLWLPEKHRAAVQEALLNGTPYTVELIRGKDHRYRAHLTFMTALPVTKTTGHGCLGIDTNPDGVALANVDHTGQPKPWPQGFAVPYPQSLSKFSGEFQVTLHPNGFLFVRMPNWPTAAESGAATSAECWPRQWWITVHQAAACVIGRRAMGFKERLTKELKQKIQAVKEQLSRKANSLPGEGKGMTRKVGRLFKRLDGKVPLHNGLTRYQQGHLPSVWQDLKQLARSSR
jgi:hypothetical protein